MTMASELGCAWGPQGQTRRVSWKTCIMSASPRTNGPEGSRQTPVTSFRQGGGGSRGRGRGAEGARGRGGLAFTCRSDAWVPLESLTQTHLSLTSRITELRVCSPEDCTFRWELSAQATFGAQWADRQTGGGRTLCSQRQCKSPVSSGRTPGRDALRTSPEGTHTRREAAPEREGTDTRTRDQSRLGAKRKNSVSFTQQFTCKCMWLGAVCVCYVHGVCVCGVLVCGVWCVCHVWRVWCMWCVWNV